MASTVKAFLQAVQTTLGTLQYSGADAFAKVWITAGLNMRGVKATNRMRACLVNDAGGALGRHDRTGAFAQRRLTVTLFSVYARDPVGESQTLELLDLYDLVVDLLHGDATNGIAYVEDSDIAPVDEITDAMVKTKTITFSYEIRRT